MHNYFAETSLAQNYELFGRPFQAIIYRLDALLVGLKSCKGRSCTHPWEVHAADSLKQALHPGFDNYYLSQPKVGFSSCELGYIKEAEENHRAFDLVTQDQKDGAGSGVRRQQTFEYTGRWHDWV